MSENGWLRFQTPKVCTCCWGLVTLGWERGHSHVCDECRSCGWSPQGCKRRFHEYARQRELCGFRTAGTVGMPVRCGHSKRFHDTENGRPFNRGHVWEAWPIPLQAQETA